MNFTFCPRCDSRAYQILKTHSFCIECNYSPTLDGAEDEPLIPAWALESLRNAGKVETPEELVSEFSKFPSKVNPEVGHAKGA